MVLIPYENRVKLMPLMQAYYIIKIDTEDLRDMDLYSFIHRKSIHDNDKYLR